MKKEEFIKFIESKGFVKIYQSPTHIDSRFEKSARVFDSVRIIIYDEEGWGLICRPGEIENEVDHLDLQFPKTEADATEFFRILGI